MRDRRPSDVAAGADAAMKTGTALERARDYVRKGYAPIPIPHREKNPGVDKWQDLRLQEADLPQHFNGQPLNIGVLLGAPSGDLVDIDLDAAEAVALADQFLPKTESEFGRPSKPRSHRLYVATIGTEKFADLDKGEDHTAMIVEIRSTGGQTVFPGSTHPSGEAVEWAHDGPPAAVVAVELRRAVVLLACSAMLARHWPGPGVRHEAALAAAGFLARADLDEGDVVKVVMGAAKAAGDAEWSDRKRGALDTVAAIRSGEVATGGPRLAELLRGDGVKVVARLRKWLGHDDAAGQAGAIDAGDQDLARVAEAAWIALHHANDPPVLFRFGGLATRIEHADDGTPAARALTPDRLRYALARAATWYTKRTTGKSRSSTTPAYPPMVVVRDMLARPDPPLPILERIVEAPMFSRAGLLHTAAGYHEDGRMFYAPAAGLDVPTLPKPVERVHVALARELLVDHLLGDFPFVSDAEVAHAVALLLLPFGRAFIDGPTPLHLIEKPTPGTGGTLLADVLTHPASGRQLAAMTEGRDEDEWRKRITSKLITSPSVIVLDNVRRRLEASALASALTATIWEDRLLGGSEQIRVPVLAAWCATGNNPALSGEIARRTLRIRLDAKTDRPWLRGGFRHADLRAWAVTNRGDLIWAALVLWQGWLDAGRPLSTRGLGMFESWARVLGGVLASAEIVGFLDNLEEFYDGTDHEGATWRRFLDAWAERFGEAETGVSDLWGLVQPAAGDPIEIDLGEGSERSQRMRLARRIGQMRDRQFGAYRIVQGTPYQGAQRWRVVPAPRAAS